MKKATTFLVLGAILMALCGPAHGQEVPPAPEAQPTIREPQVVVLKAGDPAPFDGFLVPEARFTKYLELDLKVMDLEGQLKIQTKLTADLDLYYNKQMEKLAEPIPWYQGPEFNRWLGFFIGVGVTVLAIYGAHELLQD